MMFTWPFNKCTTGFLSFVKATSCDADFFKYTDYAIDYQCLPSPSNALVEISTNPAVLDCPVGDPVFSKPFQVKCIASEAS
jgi:hypothetical protein